MLIAQGPGLLRHHQTMPELVSGASSAAPPDHRARTARTAELVDQLHAIVQELEEMHPGRKFPSTAIS